jgi:hypothetical protein
MCRRYKLKVRDKRRSKLMQTLGTLLELKGGIDKEVFMSRFATIIDDTLYMNRKIGSGRRKDWQKQIATCPHEINHAVDARRHPQGTTGFFWDYGLYSRKRALYEAKGYSSQLIFHYWWTGNMMDTKRLADILKKYQCNKGDRRAAQRYLNKVKRILLKGGVPGKHNRDGITWLVRNGYTGRGKLNV